jgi:outer membrane protein OmpA-like peptidoglycan-associated protein
MVNRFSFLVKIGVAFLSAVSLVGASINSDGNKGVVRTLSAETHGQLKLNIVAGLDYGQANDYLKGPVDSTGVAIPKPVDYSSPDTAQMGIVEPARLISSNLSLSLGILSFWDISLSLPFYYDWAGFGDLSDGGLGDLEISTKLRQPPIKNVFFQSYYISVTAPVGMRTRGLFPRHPYLFDSTANSRTPNPATSFYSYENPILKGLLLWTLDLAASRAKIPLSIHLNLGGALSTDWHKRNTAIGGFALEYTPADYITLFADCYGEVRWSSFSRGVDFFRDPFYVTPGVRINTPAGVYLYLAGDFCVSSRLDQVRNNWQKGEGSPDGRFGYSTLSAPAYGVQFGFGWNGFLTAQDDDRDGIANDVDRCPKLPEDIDGFEDSDGCPDYDNDADGIPDSLDKCPNNAEDRDGFQDEDGCPDIDNDKDGIPDLKDNCPNVAEDFDGFEDRDGCPDFDNDKDGVPDSVDKCPNDPEDIDGFQDSDGCPDLDNDQDGIPDLKDKCPNQPENFNGYLDDDGCPDTIPPPPAKKREPDMPRQQTLNGLQFRGKTAELLPETYRFLDPLIRVMKEFPDVEIEIRGFFDSADKYDNATQITQVRAEAVRQYLATQGIAPQRMRAVGMGGSYPIADNRTAAGRAQNRRIEVIRTK